MTSNPWAVVRLGAFAAYLALAGCGDNIHPKAGDDAAPPIDAPSSVTDSKLPDGPLTDGGMVDAMVPGDAGCTPPLIECNGLCLDPNTDQHCGGCNTDCTLASEVCTGGICCASGSINDNGHCCPTGDHYDNGICCASGEANTGGICCPTGDINDSGHCCPTGDHYDNGICCPSGQANTGGICCPTGDINCSGTCASPTGGDTSCGGCPGMGGTDCTLTNQTCQGGICCPAGDVNTGGICCLPTEFNVGGICCPSAADLNCNGTCSAPLTDNGNCGGCAGAGGTDCTALGETCSSGICCAAGTTNTNGICCLAGQHNSNGICCGAGTDNINGICCQAGQINANGICCASGQSNCGNQCVNENTDPNNCGSCGGTCGTGTSCLTGHCCTVGDNLCNGVCSDPTGDDKNCGGCAGAGGTDCTASNKLCSSGLCCPAGEFNSSGLCCAVGKVNVGGICCNAGESNCNGTCVNEQTDTSHCGSCTKQCAALELCSSGTCSSTCSQPNTACPNDNPPVCTDLSTDPNNCGVCGTVCTGGEQCTNSSCQCPQADPDLCSGQCIDPQNDPSNCGGCAGSGGVACGAGQACDTGHCCSTGTQYCASTGTCSNTQKDPNNCGTCGHQCGTGQTCTNGACECPFGEIECNGACVIAGTDEQNCGSCGNVCGTGVNAGKPYCISNGCTAACPSPLIACGGDCVNPLDDNAHCGGCPGTACTNGQACTNGTCGTELTVGNPPPKCIGAGPPIVVPVGGGKDECTGNLSQTAFTFGLCSCTDIGPLSQLIQTDAFDSTVGPYIGPGFAGTACTVDSDCGKTCNVSKTPCAQSSNCPTGETCTRYPIPCVDHTCSGGGVGTNGTESNSAVTNIGGDFWAANTTTGVANGNDVTVLRRFYDAGPLKYAKQFSVYGDSNVFGGFAAQGGGKAAFGVGPTPADTGTLHEQTTACASLPSTMTLSGSPQCVQQTVSFAKPCSCNAADLIPVKAIVQHFANPANNDNAAIGLSADALANPGAGVRLDLACGYYYFTSINGAKPITVVVHGHVGIFVSGAIRSSQGVIFDLDPTATLDVFVGGVMNVSQNTELGSPAYPRNTRMYFGSASCAGGSGTCSANEDCCSGVCTGGSCVGGGGNLTQAISLSNTGAFDGLLWAGYGTFTHSNSVTMYGAIFANHFDASGSTVIHYDNGIVDGPNECPPPTGVCDSCSDCGNQACVLGQCSATCTSDVQCCPPLHCDIGGTNSCTL